MEAIITRRLDGGLQYSGFLIARGLAWPAAALCLIAHLTWADPAFSMEARMCAGLLGAIAVIGAAYARPFMLPLMPIVLVRFYFALGFPVFSPPRLVTAVAGRIRVSSRALDEAALASLLFIGTFIGVFYLLRPLGKRGAKKLSRLLDRPEQYTVRDTIAARCLALLSLSIALTITLSPARQAVFGGLGYPATLLASPVLSLGLLYWDAERTQTKAAWLLYSGAALFLGACGLLAGMLGSAVEPLVLTILFLWTTRRHFPFGLVILVTTLVLALNSAKHRYRDLSWRAREEISVAQRAGNWVTALEQTYGGEASEGFSKGASSTASRLSSLVAVAHMFDWVPGKVPFAGPEAWINLPLSYVPRVLWPDKPQPAAEFNSRYTTTFRLQSPEMTRTTTLSLPSIGDGYWRMGWLGVLVEALVLGIMAGLYQGLADPASRGLCILSIGFASGIGPESHVLGLVGTQVQYWCMTFAVLWMAQVLPPLIAGAPKTRLAFRKRSLRPPGLRP